MGDRGLANREQRNAALMFWATIIIGIPIAILSFIKDNFEAFAVTGGVIGGFFAFLLVLKKLNERFPSLEHWFVWGLLALSVLGWTIIVLVNSLT
jgi:hypothetical protein